MTVSAQPLDLACLPAFSGCSEETLERIKTEGSTVSFSIGQTVSTGSIVPNRVLVLLKGKARLLGRHNGQLNTLAMLGPGTLVGLPSLLRAEGCEYVSAATALDTWAIPDTLIAEVYAGEASFRTWCNSTLFPAELASLINSLLKESKRTPLGLIDVLREVMPIAHAVEGTNDVLQSLEEQQQVFVASASNAQLKSTLSSGEKLPTSQGIFGLRLLILQREIVAQITAGQNINSASKTKKQEQNEPRDHETGNSEFPVRTSLNLNGKDPRKSLTLITGRGELQESVACFRMLTQLMGLPFRRDSIEKTIRDALRRGKKPTLPMLGQLAAGMGLHASGTRVHASMCTRMNVPCLINWTVSVWWYVATRAVYSGPPSPGMARAHTGPDCREGAQRF